MHEDYPVEIDLGRTESELGNASMPATPAGKKGKPRKFYPTLYIDSVPGMHALPKEGMMLVHYRRKSLRLEESGDGKDSTGATIEVRKICLPEGAADDDADMKSAMKAFAKGEGVDTGSEESDADEEDNDEDEE